MNDVFDFIKKSKLEHNLTYIHGIQLYDKISVDFFMYDLYGYEYDEKIEGSISSSLQKNRIGQQNFRECLIQRYNNCIITRDEPIFCEACHIIPYNKSKNCYIDNGILLTASLHKLFDKYLMTIDSQTHSVIFSDKLINNHNYEKYNNTIIRILGYDTPKYLKEHNERFFELNTKLNDK
jgi:hypothetical protein